MRIFAGILIGWILIAAAGLAFIYSGLYDVAATEPDNRLMRWALATTRERSVEARADEVQAPAEFTEAQVQQGFAAYHETCVICHGAPGQKPSEVGKGLTPEPPELSEASEEVDNAELFWIVKHGIKMTGMPAFGPTHEDGKIWSVVAFLQRLPQLSPEQYKQMVQAAGADQYVDPDEKPGPGQQDAGEGAQ